MIMMRQVSAHALQDELQRLHNNGHELITVVPAYLTFQSPTMAHVTEYMIYYRVK